MSNPNRAILLLTQAVLETVNETMPSGAPGGPMYAAFMTKGMTLDQFESLMGGMVEAGFLEKRGQCYFITTSGKDFMGRLQRAA